MIKVNQEELAKKIKKLKEKAAEKKAKAEGKKSDPEARKARKKVKRAQRKLRSAKAYKSAGKKTEAKAEEKGFCVIRERAWEAAIADSRIMLYRWFICAVLSAFSACVQRTCRAAEKSLPVLAPVATGSRLPLPVAERSRLRADRPTGRPALPRGTARNFTAGKPRAARFSTCTPFPQRTGRFRSAPSSMLPISTILKAFR